MPLLRVRVSPALRCSYCHDVADHAACKACPLCRTQLHDRCWGEARRCPTLGCWSLRETKPRVVVPPAPRVLVAPAPRADDPEPRLYLYSLFSGTFGALLWLTSSHVIPAFKTMFEETGICVPASTELVVETPTWVWGALAALSVVLLTLKDRWVQGRVRQHLNRLHVVLVVGAGLGLLWSLFAPLTHSCFALIEHI